MLKGIYSRGFLPHWDLEVAVQAITFHVVDSLPAAKAAAWKRELADVDEEQRKTEFRRLVARYEDAGQGSCPLGRPDCAAIVQNKLIEGHGDACRLIEWYKMPDHVHVLIKVIGSLPLGEILRSWKGPSALEINRLVGCSGPLWQREYFDRVVRDLDRFHSCRAYICNNPVKVGMCNAPEDWEFSSAGAAWTDRAG